MFVGFGRDDKPISENTVNKAPRTMDFNTKKSVQTLFQNYGM